MLEDFIREDGPDALGEGRAELPATEEEEDAAGATMTVKNQAGVSLVVVELTPDRALCSSGVQRVRKRKGRGGGMRNCGVMGWEG